MTLDQPSSFQMYSNNVRRTSKPGGLMANGRSGQVNVFAVVSALLGLLVVSLGVALILLRANLHHADELATTMRTNMNEAEHRAQRCSVDLDQSRTALRRERDNKQQLHDTHDDLLEEQERQVGQLHKQIRELEASLADANSAAKSWQDKYQRESAEHVATSHLLQEAARAQQQAQQAQPVPQQQPLPPVPQPQPQAQPVQQQAQPQQYQQAVPPVQQQQPAQQQAVPVQQQQQQQQPLPPVPPAQTAQQQQQQQQPNPQQQVPPAVEHVPAQPASPAPQASPAPSYEEHRDRWQREAALRRQRAMPPPTAEGYVVEDSLV